MGKVTWKRATGNFPVPAVMVYNQIGFSGG
jgi:hypothetical protein